ncbi:acetyl/propionyl/methylcrotonyl-CoA carboxylase subunit alpha [Ketobacter sp. MCCC 1A13808]|uniref:acetyl/propionyl/methylcrotonyl-CoA carboxylase subunit alpha n=1 Tax=Ketobacter sp. MCCC 1A13808 TaxID=2602738 RepID=UPI000F1FDA06|nr:acetyl/propionyl/methylcrotonyl-CoA carboxylase subunit alpha [Ketobacter sp. MCCC 1A13808]MVF12568.1 acetyl/propionyl/methylcrotonyl-CoA carboxylase subunit alpha [Ketobacter sp. MCCC 1A13808]RLP55631.1 MAG: acetyl/propionyl/methylcrotonyl-CoA carboxylase subunit alpha [Ketobacter sp.]
MSNDPVSFKKVLIANRGEIACRVIKTLKQLDIRSVAVYSDADANAQHVLLADQAIHIGPAPVSESYLDMERIVTAATLCGAEAIHPGYGFLSENPQFAQLCANNNVVLIGPPASAMVAMGSKAQAKAIMGEAGVSLVPGYHGERQETEFLKQEASRIGYPVLLKASYGGGGKGMRTVFKETDLEDAIQSCKRESKASFGNDHLIIEKYIVDPRHVEIQVFADQQGQVVYLFERDCSIQRRHQKVVEEAPAQGLDESTRQQMGQSAVQAAKAIGYVGAGTVEFLLDANGDFYFMEMNTRLQVEHPVTEMITGQDLVAWQVQVAEGHPLPLTQQQLTLSGHSIEVRIYAEDPENEFLPCTGQIHSLQLPQASRHLRVDSGVVSGDEISVHYDPMIAKLIVWDYDRMRAVHRMEKALTEFQIAGLKTNLPFLSRIIKHPAFTKGIPTTHFIDEQHEALLVSKQALTAADFVMAGLYQVLSAASQYQDGPWSQLHGWQLNGSDDHQYDFLNEGDVVTVNIAKVQQAASQARRNAGVFEVVSGDQRYTVSAQLVTHENVQRLRLSGDIVKTVSVFQHEHQITLFDEGTVKVVAQKQLQLSAAEAGTDAQLKAPMNGRIVKVLVSAGDSVQPDDALVIVEAMKMEHTIRAHKAAQVLEVMFAEGDLVSEGDQLIELQLEDEEAE